MPWDSHKPPFPWPEPMVRKALVLDRLVKLYERQGRPESHIQRIWRVLAPQPLYQGDF